jgi:serine/threonine-protein kinase
MSTVFVARDNTLGRMVVVKVLPYELAATVSVDRFKREIMLSAALQHPHIVPVLSAGETDGLPFFIMPFVEGESLRARLARGPLSVREAVSIMKDVSRALAYATRPS